MGVNPNSKEYKRMQQFVLALHHAALQQRLGPSPAPDGAAIPGNQQPGTGWIFHSGSIYHPSWIPMNPKKKGKAPPIAPAPQKSDPMQPQWWWGGRGSGHYA